MFGKGAYKIGDAVTFTFCTSGDCIGHLAIVVRYESKDGSTYQLVGTNEPSYSFEFTSDMSGKFIVRFIIIPK